MGSRVSFGGAEGRCGGRVAGSASHSAEFRGLEVSWPIGDGKFATYSTRLVPVVRGERGGAILAPALRSSSSSYVDRPAASCVRGENPMFRNVVLFHRSSCHLFLYATCFYLCNLIHAKSLDPRFPHLFLFISRFQLASNLSTISISYHDV